MTEMLFIAGAQKTATSTLMGILNCHPDILLLYEAFNLHPKKRSNYDKIYINAVKELEAIYSCTNYSIIECYKASRPILCNGHDYRYFGGKIVGLENIDCVFSKYKCIYTVRDLRSWMAKESVNSMYKVKKNRKNVTTTSINYIIQFIKTFRYDSCIKISTEDIVRKNTDIISKLENFLNIDLYNYTKDWHTKINNYDNNIKMLCPDWSKHSSSLQNSGNLDITLEYNQYTAWNCILTIFDKYYNALDHKFSNKEIDNDLIILDKFANNKEFYVNYADIYLHNQEL